MSIFNEIHGSRYCYSDVNFDRAADSITLLCKYHGSFRVTVSAHSRGVGCPKCLPKFERTTESFIERARYIHGVRYDYAKSNYVTQEKKTVVTCPTHGDFEISPANHIKGSGCKKCHFEGRAKPSSDFIREAIEVHGNRYDYSKSKYVKAHEKVTIVCMEHGDFSQTPNAHLKGNGCPSCASNERGNRHRMEHEDFVASAREVHGDAYEYLGEYEGSKTPLEIGCKNHGPFKQRPNDHLSGHGCPSCSLSGPSFAEIEICEAISSMGIEVEQSRRGLLSDNKEIDIYLPDHKIGIEFNGLYWHSDKFLPNDYHQKKSLDAMSNEIRLIHVWEDDWNDPVKREIVLNKIKSKCGMGERVYARKCEIDFEIGTEEIKDFLIKNHIQGYVTSKYIGLRDNEELVAVLGMKRTKDHGVYDLTRFASSKSVVGGFSKLLAHWKKHNEWNKIITYAHLDYSHGNLYKVNGFEEEHITKPNYAYTLNGKARESRQKYMKHRLASRLENFDPNLTERENMINNGYLRVYDSGSIQYSQKNVNRFG